MTTVTKHQRTVIQHSAWYHHKSPPPAAPSPSFNRSLAASLPVELLHLILDACVSIFPPYWLRPLTLVCRAWRAPAQRGLFSKVSTSRFPSIEDLADFLEAHKVLASYIKSVRAEGYRKYKWATGELGKEPGEVLRLLPNLTELELFLNCESPDDTGDFSALNMPLLEHLTVHQVDSKKDPKAIRQILTATPNITSLSLSHRRGTTSWFRQTARDDLSPLHLARLTRLTLEGQFPRAFEELLLLSSERIDDLSLEDGWNSYRPNSSLTDFLASIENQIKTLRIPGGPLSDTSTGALLQACPVIETLFISHVNPRLPKLPRTLPPSLHTLHCMPHLPRTSSRDNIEKYLRNVHLTHLKRLYIGNTVAEDGLKKLCRDGRVELFDDSESLSFSL